MLDCRHKLDLPSKAQDCTSSCRFIRAYLFCPCTWWTQLRSELAIGTRIVVAQARGLGLTNTTF